MKIGYVRVSSEGQNTARQELLMQELGVDQVYMDQCSGKNTNRPQLQTMLSFVRSGDTVIVESISRFARNTRDLLELIDKLNQKGVIFISKKEAIDTTTPTDKFMLTVFGAVAELERGYLLQRQKEGIDIAKAGGKYKGRKPIQHPPTFTVRFYTNNYAVFAHKVFPNLLNQSFTSEKVNRIWCTDFTYLFLSNGFKRYNCSIIDLYDRSIVASVNGKEITSDLAINALKKAIASQPKLEAGLILHSDQGYQYTSEAFTGYCTSANITQSMSRAGCPYDNAPMERYFNLLKTELIYHHHYHNDEELNRSINNYAYVWYNHVRPHTFNRGLTPFEARSGSKNIRLKCYKKA